MLLHSRGHAARETKLATRKENQGLQRSTTTEYNHQLSNAAVWAWGEAKNYLGFTRTARSNTSTEASAGLKTLPYILNLPVLLCVHRSDHRLRAAIVRTARQLALVVYHNAIQEAQRTC